MNTNQIRLMIEELRREAAVCLSSKDVNVRARATGLLRMVNVQKVLLRARGESVTIEVRK